VGIRAALSRALRRWQVVACAFATLFAVAAPAALGPALGPLLQELGAQQEHMCKCGMAPGKCGCPECARAEHERLRERLPDAVPVVKGDCEKDAPAMAFAALPAGPLPPAWSVLPVPSGERIPMSATSTVPFDTTPEPPTPPPRLASV
jgi:hypothetical protein